ncbi:MAG: ureidoglycolate hydrolase [Armatimonadetes bacterium]|nr:ureidoglycolate hydrolase [Armatimonadota bacterium]NIM22971.1 ureidoglycolate hydrolase [Armatimonadota bacterium]NIM66842.1 ureidoglycolate hydrolase [Armatimonadota bacterium]NIM75383.1 ureidoglycolate hydrolase [Armatimonadota bacterium]NIN05030.1 ureidoglycolate hydrolase [Armatimonadota bacterium]
MREIPAQKLSAEKFAAYGVFADMIAPQGEKIGEAPILFYRDMVQLPLGTSTIASLSVCQVEKREPVIDVSEFHTAVGEAILPLDADVVIHVAAATPTDAPPADKIEAYLVPKGTLVVLKPGVWHHAPFAVDTQRANVLIVLPERAYAMDCTVRPIPEKDQIKVSL